MQIISADERLREHRGAKVLIVGPTGVGKTSQLRTLDPARTLFVDVEAGDLAVLDLPVPTIRIDDWPDRPRSRVPDRRTKSRASRRRRAIRRRIMKRSADRSKIWISIRQSSSTA